MRTTIKIIAALLLAAVASPAILAAPQTGGHVTPEQLEGVQPQQSRDEVIRLLGQPANEAMWLDGTQSLIYNTDDSGSSNAVVYIDFDSSSSGKFTYYTIQADESSNSDPG